MASENYFPALRYVNNRNRTRDAYPHLLPTRQHAMDAAAAREVDKIRDTADSSYTDYKFCVSTMRNFEQELLWHGRKVIVPDDFRQKMTVILKDMVRSYETGENTVDE